MEKQRQIQAGIAENFCPTAKKIIKYFVDPEERNQQLNELREMALFHVKMSDTFDWQCKAIEKVALQCKEIKDLEIEKVIKLKLQIYL